MGNAAVMTQQKTTEPSGNSRSPYGWMAITSLAAIATGKFLLPFPGQQQAQNVSLAIEALAGAALGLGAFRLLQSRRRTEQGARHP
jgi:hypothetical protein